MGVQEGAWPRHACSLPPPPAHNHLRNPPRRPAVPPDACRRRPPARACVQSQVLVVEEQRLKASPHEAIARVWEHLAVPPLGLPSWKPADVERRLGAVYVGLTEFGAVGWHACVCVLCFLYGCDCRSVLLLIE